jgi:hypothetical protein
VEVCSGGATLLRPKEVLHMRIVLVEVRTVKESARVNTTKVEVMMNFLSNIVGDEMQKL